MPQRFTISSTSPSPEITGRNPLYSASYASNYDLLKHRMFTPTLHNKASDTLDLKSRIQYTIFVPLRKATFLRGVFFVSALLVVLALLLCGCRTRRLDEKAMAIADRYGMWKEFLARKSGMEPLDTLEEWDMATEDNWIFFT